MAKARAAEVSFGGAGIAEVDRADHGPSPRRGVTARAIILGLALTPANVFFLVTANWTVGGFTGYESLFLNTVAVLFFLATLNVWLRRRRSRWALGAGEMLTVYLMLGVSTGLVCGVWDIGGSLSAMITYPFWFATPENRWQEIMWPNLPAWLMVSDRTVLEGFYSGRSSAYTWAVLRAWAGPACWWAALLTGFMWVALCLNSIVRRRWADEEKLPFPIAILPVQLADARSGLLNNRLFWVAVAVSGGMGIWNTLATLFPALPAIPLSFDYTSYVENRHPWSFIRYRAVGWWPWALGLSYLMPLDLAFSLFFFDLMWTAEYVVSGYLGWATSSWGGFPYGDQQTAGGFVAILLGALWLDRRYLLAVVERSLGRRPPFPREGEEALSYRAACAGAVVGLGALWWMLARGGMQVWVIPAFLAIYFLMTLVISRLRAQLGPPTHQLYGAMPNWILPTLAGTRALGPRTLGMLAVLRPYLQEQRNNPTPLQLEAFKMAEGGRMERRRVALALAIVPPLAMLSYFWATIHIGYHMGIGTGNTDPVQLQVAGYGADWLDGVLRYPSGASTQGAAAMGVGLGMTLALTFLKLRFQWWPLHPVAYPIGIASTIQAWTPAIFLTWLFKALLLRYGGLRAHRRALPFFLGLLAGSAAVAVIERVLFEALGLRL